MKPNYMKLYPCHIATQSWRRESRFTLEYRRESSNCLIQCACPALSRCRFCIMNAKHGKLLCQLGWTIKLVRSKETARSDLSAKRQATQDFKLRDQDAPPVHPWTVSPSKTCQSELDDSSMLQQTTSEWSEHAAVLTLLLRGRHRLLSWPSLGDSFGDPSTSPDSLRKVACLSSLLSSRRR